jgi:hypothetical protein
VTTSRWSNAYLEFFGERSDAEEAAFRFGDDIGRPLEVDAARRAADRATAFRSRSARVQTGMSDAPKPAPATNPPETPTYPDPASGDPREGDLGRAHEIDPSAGRSDDPRVDGGDPRATHTHHTDDDAWQNEFTEETMPPPEAREDAAHDLELDPT